MHLFQSLLGSAALACLVVSSACAPAASTDSRVYRMGDRVSVGSLVYNVFEDQWRAKLGDGPDARIPKDRFLLLRLSVVNGGASDMLVPTMTLVDDSGQQYSELPQGDQVPQWAGYIRRIKPANTLEGQIVFDVPPKHYMLRVSDENSQKTRDIDIPLNFAGDAPDVPVQ